ncbi:MAG: cysteine--tRNA ligase [Candidatus Nealsonbacteria bacterium]
MLKMYDTLTGKKKPLKPRQNKKLEIFVCGPTVYDYSHIGHARTYIAFDVIVKYLNSKGYKVNYLQNITDLDDKIIQRSKEKLTTPEKLAKTFEQEYLKDMEALKVKSVTKYARATDYMTQIINQIQRLSEKGYAYLIPDDGIYYDISKFKNYGKLSRRTITQAEDAVTRIDEAKGKINKGDFCLWKFSKRGEPNWESSWGKGRPGWHIEDTAITEANFGAQYDIHGGGRDLTFPHHEAEIAQMEAISNKSPMVNYWLHTGFLTVKGQKMSKSLGNFITIKELLKEYSARLLRFIIIKSHYRSPLDYNEKIIKQAEKELDKIDEFIERLTSVKIKEAKSQQLTDKAEKDFQTAMEDDFNTPKALASIFQLLSKGNDLISKNKLNEKEAKEILDFFKKIDDIFGFILTTKTKEKIPQSILSLVKQREKYRKEENWKKADELRKKIQQLSYRIEDTEESSKLKQKAKDND